MMRVDVEVLSCATHRVDELLFGWGRPFVGHCGQALELSVEVVDGHGPGAGAWSVEKVGE